MKVYIKTDQNTLVECWDIPAVLPNEVDELKSFIEAGINAFEDWRVNGE